MRFRARPYRKPVWLRLIVGVLSLGMWLIISQVVLRDDQIFAVIRDAAENVGEFVAVEVAYRKQQEVRQQGTVQPGPTSAPELSFGATAKGTPQVHGAVTINRLHGGVAANIRTVRIGD